MNARSHSIRCGLQQRTAMASGAGGRRHQGYTLLEMGFVITVMGILALLMAHHLTTYVRPHDAQAADKIVQDVWRVVHATRLWSSRHGGAWPNTAGRIDLDALGPSGSGYLTAMPTTPVSANAGTCGGNSLSNGEYEALGHDRGTGGNTLHANADDLIIRLCVEGDRQFADAIASRIPFGYAENAGRNYTTKLQEFDIQTRLIGGSASRSSLFYVRHTGENRPVVTRDLILNKLTLATSDESGAGETRVKLNAKMDADAGVKVADGNVDKAFFKLSKSTDSVGTFDKATPSWIIRDRRNNNWDTLWTLVGFEGDTVGSTTTYTPYASGIVERNSSRTHGDVEDMRWTLQYFNKDGTDPATFDLYLAKDDADSGDTDAYDCHKGIHAQLCEIERRVHEFLDAATFPSGTPDYTETGLEDPACRALPAC